MICLPICNLDVKNEHLIIRKMSIVIDCYVPSEVRNVIDPNVVLKMLKILRTRFFIINEIIERGVSEHKDSILSLNMKF